MDVTDLELESRLLGGLPIVNAFYDRLGIDRLLEAHVPGDGRLRVAPAAALGVVIRNLAVRHAPVYALSEWASRYDPAVVGLVPDEVELLNDDRVGRMLARLFDTDRASLLTRLVLDAVDSFDIDLSRLHNDSTSLKLSGAYATADGQERGGKPTPAVRHGFSKDHRPDLQQLVWILTVTADGAVPIAFRVMDSGASVPVFVGFVTDWEHDYAPKDATVRLSCVDALGRLARVGIRRTLEQGAGERSGVRVSRALDLIPFGGPRNIDPGTSTLAATEFDVNALNYLQQVARSENGRLFVARDGVLTFQGRASALDRTPGLALVGSNVDVDGIQFHDVAWSDGSELLANTIVTSGASENEFVAVDATSVAEFDTIELSRTGLLLDRDQEVADYGLYLLSFYAQPQPRFTSVTVKLTDTSRLSEQERARLLAVDIGARLTVVFQPPGGGVPISRLCLVDGVSHARSRQQSTVTFRLAPVDTTPYMIYDDPEFGFYHEGFRWLY